MDEIISNVGKMIKKSRGLCYQTRWNMYPKIRVETIAEHSFMVALILMGLLLVKGRGNLSFPDMEMIAGSMLHDLEESCTGDIPTLTKRSLGNELGVLEEAKREMGLNNLHYADYLFKFFRKNRLVELADKLAALLYAVEQERCGVKLFRHIKNQIATQIVKEYDEVFPDIKEFLKALDVSYEREEYTRKFTHVGEKYDADEKCNSTDISDGTVVREKSN